MSDVYINNIQKFMPNEPVFNEEMEEYLGYIGGKKSKARKIVLRSNGIKRRFYVLEKGTQKALYSNAEITAKAIQKLETEDFGLDDVQCLSCGTTSPDQLMPNHALMVHGQLQLNPIEVLSAAGICLSGINALKYVYYAIKCDEIKTGISTGSEAASLILSAKNFQEESKNLHALEENPHIAFEKDFLRWMLSDGAGAMLLQNRPNTKDLSLKIHWIDVLSYAGQMPVCMYSGGEIKDNEFKGWRNYTQDEVSQKSLLSVSQDVKLLNENIVEYTVIKPLKEILQKRDVCASEIDYFLPHYSSEFFKDKLAQGLKAVDFEIADEKWFTNLTQFGNTGSASMYIILEELFHSKRLKKGEKLLCYVPESGRFSTAFMMLEVI
jgi:3-oxoacyl-[acyl-carrier-protein] synthase-3